MSGDEGTGAARAHAEAAHPPAVATSPTDEEALLDTPLVTLLDVLPDAVAIYTTDGRVLRANSRARALFALDDAPEFASISVEERLAITMPRDLDGAPLSGERWHVTRLLRGETITGEDPAVARLRGPDGQERAIGFTGAPIRDNDGRIIGAVAIGREVVERGTRDEDHAQLLRRQQAAILDRTHDAIFIWELDGPITYWNHGAELLYGYTAEEAVGRFSHELLRTVHPTTSETFEALLRQEGEWTGELRHTTRDGRTVDVLSRHQLLRDDTGKQYVLETSRDITERKQMERELAERAAALEVANRQMDEFLSIVGHELRTPLASIKPNLQLAERHIQRLAEQLGAETPEAGARDRLALLHTLVDRAQHQVRRMTRLVNDLTDASRIQSDRLELMLEPCDLAAIVRECVEEQRQSTSSRSIELDLPETPVPVEADPLRIGQVVMNYLTNALRYTPPEQPIRVTVRETNGQARVAVRDEGPGIPLEEQDRIWQRFHRVTGTQSRSEYGVGLGLGLFISKSLVERHGGQTGVESSPGQGATFWFALPLARSHL